MSPTIPPEEENKDMVPIDRFTDQFRTIMESVARALSTEKDAEIAQLRIQNETLRRDIEQGNAKSEARFEAVAQDVKGVQDASARRLLNSDKYYVRTVLGRNFVPEISGKRMTKLLKIVGIMGENDYPFAEFRKGAEPLAKVKPYCEYETWLFHAEKVTKRVNGWLEDHDLYSDFYNTTTKDERDSFIDMLFDEYC